MEVKRICKNGRVVLFVAALLWLIPQIAAYFLLRRDGVLEGALAAVQESLADSYGLDLRLQKPTPGPGLGFQATTFSIRDLRDRGRPEVLRARRIYVKLSLLNLLRQPKHPEAAVAEIYLDRPKLTVNRAVDGTWLWERFFTSPEVKNYFRPKIRLHGARLSPPGELLPHPVGDLTVSDGLIDMRAYPRIRGWMKSTTDLDPGMELMVKADYDTERISGWAYLNCRNASPAVWQGAGWIPADLARIDRGRLTGDARLTLGRESAVQTVRAELSDGRVRLPQSALPDTDISIQGRLNLRGSQLQLSSLRLRAGRNSLSGSLALDLQRQDPPVRADLTLSRLDLDILSKFYPALPSSGIDGFAKGRLKATGRLSAPVLEGRLDLAGNLRHPRLPPLEEIRVKGRFAGQGYNIQSIQARLGRSVIAGHGRVDLSSSPRLELTFSSRRMSLDGILEDLGQSGWQGSADLNGRLTVEPETWKLEASTIWRRLAWHNRSVPDGRTRITMSGDRGGVRWSGGGQIGSGTIKSAGRLEAEQWDGRAHLVDIDLTPVSAFMPTDGRDLAGRATGDLVWRGPLRETRVEFLGEVESFLLAGRGLDTLRAHLRLRDTEVVVETAQFVKGRASGSIHGSYDWDRKQLAMDLVLHQMPLDLIEPGAPGHVEARFKAAGRWPETITGGGWAHLTGLAWQDLQLGMARVEFDLNNGGILIRRGTIEANEGRLELTGRIALGGRNELDLKTAEFAWDGEALRGVLPVQANPRGRLTGEAQVIGTLADPIVIAGIKIGPGQIFEMNWDSMEADLRWQKRLIVERGSIRAAGAEIDVEGTVGASGWDLAVHVEDLDLANVAAMTAYNLQAPLAGRMELNGRIGGPQARPSFLSWMEVEDFSFGSLKSDRLQGELRLERGILTVREAKAWTGRQAYAAEGRIDLGRQVLDVALSIDRGDLAALLDLAGLRGLPATGVVTGTGRITGRLSQPEVRAGLDIEEGMLGGTALAGEMVFSYDGHTINCQRAELDYGGGRVTAAGRLGATQCQLKVTASSLPMADLSRLAGLKEMFQGRADFQLSIDRSGSDMGGEFHLELRDRASLAGIPLDRAVAGGVIRGRQVLLSQAELNSGGYNLSLAGRLPLPDDLGPLSSLFKGVSGSREEIDLTIQGSNVPVVLLNPALKDVVSFNGGQLDISAKLGGTWKKPTGQGRLSLRAGQGKWSFLPAPFRELEAEARLDGRSLLLDQAGMRVGDGAATAGGTISLAERGPFYDLWLKTVNLPYKDPAFFDGFATANLTVKGGPVPLAEGAIRVRETKITVGPAVSGPPPPPIRLDIVLSAGKDVRFFLPGIADLPITGDLQLRGTLAAPTLSGVVNASRGTVLVYGEYFDVHMAVGVFSHDRGYLPYVDLEGSKVVRGIKVHVKAKGEIKEEGLSITLWSEPSLSQQEIINLLGGKVLPGEKGDGAFSGGLELVIGTVFGQLSDDFRRWIDADEFQVSLDDQTGVFGLELGKYISSDFYLSYEVLFGESTTRIWSFDYELTPNLVVSGIFSTMEEPKWALSYQIKF